MPSDTKPHFYCERCGEEVPAGAKSCPSCGQRFASIRCPGCGFVGGEDSFTDGCPSCGYKASAGESPPPPASASPRQQAKAKPRERPADPLPAWVYVVAIGGLLAVGTAILSKLI